MQPLKQSKWKCLDFPRDLCFITRDRLGARVAVQRVRRPPRRPLPETRTQQRCGMLHLLVLELTHRLIALSDLLQSGPCCVAPVISHIKPRLVFLEDLINYNPVTSTTAIPLLLQVLPSHNDLLYHLCPRTPPYACRSRSSACGAQHTVNDRACHI
jgi:hypothetical protein